MFNTPARCPNVNRNTDDTHLQAIEIFELCAISVQMDLKSLYVNAEPLPQDHWRSKAYFQTLGTCVPLTLILPTNNYLWTFPTACGLI